jgi:O-acetyl-ADP-ribose deacetylase (regulator of RNase III)
MAALIAVTEIRRFLLKNKYPEMVTFVAFSDDSYETYRKFLDK